MTQRSGDRRTFAVETGETLSASLRVVDLWAAGKRLTTDDNVAHVSSLRHYMLAAASQVHQRDVPPSPFPGRSPEEIFGRLQADDTDLREQYWFMRWSEIVDNVSCYAYLNGDLVIVFSFWRMTHPFPDDLGKVFVATISPDELVATAQEAADNLA